MADTMTPNAAQGNAAAAGGDGSTNAASAAAAGDAGAQGTAQNGQGQQGQQGATLGANAFAATAGDGQSQQGQGDKQGTGDADKDKQPDAAAIPENAAGYAFEAPADIPVNEAMLGKVKEIALAGKLSQEQFANIMPQLLQLDAARFQGIQQAYAKQRAEGIQALQQEWGQEFGANVTLAQKAVSVFGSPELGALFDATGIGDHPLIVKTFAMIGKALSEDQAFGRGGSNAEPQTAAEILYPQMKF